MDAAAIPAFALKSVSSRQSAVGSQQSAVSSQQSAVDLANHKSQIANILAVRRQKLEVVPVSC